MNLPFIEPISTSFTVSVKSEKQAYLFICINEMLYSLGIINDKDYATNYAVISDNEHFKLF